MVAYQKADFAHNVQGRMQHQVQRPGDDSFSAVFDRNDSKLRSSRHGGLKYLVKIGASNTANTGAKKSQRRFFGESAHGTKKGNPLRLFKGPTG